MGLEDILRTNVTDAGGTLSESEFFAALDGAMRYERKPTPLIVSNGTLNRARDDADRLERTADQARMELYRLRRGWRRIRLLKRRRLAERYLDQSCAAAALRATFGSR